jgi:hypothetical protein
MVNQSRGKKVYSFYRQRPVISNEIDVNRIAKTYTSVRPVEVTADSATSVDLTGSITTEAGESLTTEAGDLIVTE